MKLAPLAAALPIAVAASAAHAVQRPDYLDERPLETAQGERGRAVRTTSWTPPASADKAWRRFQQAHGRWQAIWDADTEAPLRIFGEGIPAPGASADDAIAEQAARTILADWIELLAPGAAPADFELAYNGVGPDEVRTVTFVQRWGRMPVVGGAVTVSFKRDRAIVLGSTASPHVAPRVPHGAAIGPRAAQASAAAWIEAVYGGAPAALDVGDPVVLPIERDRDDFAAVLEHRVVVPVTVDLAEPRARWTVYVDAVTAEPVARRQLLAFAQGTVRYRVPDREPRASRSEYLAAFARHLIADMIHASNALGVFTWEGDDAVTVAPALTGPYARVIARDGAPATTQLVVEPDGTAVWDLSTSERGDAQLTAFIHANIAKQFGMRLNPQLNWLFRQMAVHVNEPGGTCNAYSNLDDIHFYPAGGGCENTARLPDVIYHEFGHSLHGQSIIHFGSFDGALSEGVSDYTAATITGDPAMGVGFVQQGVPLRHIDPADREHVWPDDASDQVHSTGLIIGGALWDLRKGLVARLGADEGRDQADRIFYGIIRRSPDIPSSFAEALATDDDDGNLANGTPNECTIRAAFGAHGLAPADDRFGVVDPPAVEGRTLRLAQLGDSGGRCPNPQITSATATWRIRGDAATGGTIELAAAGDAFVGVLPEVPDDTVIQYQLVVALDDGGVRRFPSNAADPWYELYVGPISILTCFDFEDDPRPLGWTLDGFDWGVPMPPPGSSDPPAAYSGSRILGTDLGGLGMDGDYEPERRVRALAPTVELDAARFERVRLQYRRWLATEDAVYDQAAVLADGAQVWRSARGNGTLHHRDREWRFHDVDLTALTRDGRVQVGFELTPDNAYQLGGWSVDDVCIVAAGPPVCGDGYLGTGEACDDGNGVDGDGCSATCAIEEPGEEVPGCCSTGRGGGGAGALLLGALTLLGARRRRRAV